MDCSELNSLTIKLEWTKKSYATIAILFQDLAHAFKFNGAACKARAPDWWECLCTRQGCEHAWGIQRKT